MVITALFVVGLAVGSFLNVVSLRFKPRREVGEPTETSAPGQNPEGEQVPYGARLFDSKIIGGRSHCLNCQKQLSWYELIPVLSFIFLRGRCSSCKKRISWQYPIVEILSGLIFVFVPYILSLKSSIFIAIWILILLLFLLLSIIDFRHYIIPDSINVSLLGLGALLTFLAATNYKLQTTNSFSGYYSNLLTFTSNIWLNHLAGLFFGLLVFGLIIFVSKGRGMGWGDFKLAGVLGLIFGWPDILISFMLSFSLGGLVGIILIIFKKKKMKEAVPFGPFLVVGAVLTFFFGFQVINSYFKLFGL